MNEIYARQIPPEMQESPLQALKCTGSEHKKAIDSLIRLYQQNYITCHEFSEKCVVLKAEYDSKTAEIFKDWGL